MRRIGLDRKVDVSEIEWDIDWDYHYGIGTTQKLMDMIEDIKTLPIKGVLIHFQDMVWNFNECFHNRSGDQFIFSFSTIPEGFVVSYKYFVLTSLITSKLKISSVHRRYQDLVLFSKIINSNGITNPSQIDTNTVKKYIDMYVEKHTIQASNMVLHALSAYVNYLVANFSQDIDVGLFNSYKWIREEASKLRTANKTPSIPDEYFDKLISVLIESMNDESASYNDRAVACVYLIMSQIGLRITEIHALRKESLKKIQLKSLGEYYYLEVESFKPGTKEQDYIIYKTYVTEIVVEAFNTLCKISEERMLNNGQDYIYMPDSSYIPAPEYISRRRFLELLAKRAPFAIVDDDSIIPYEGINSVYVKYKGVRVWAPKTKQFRVKVCTDLYYKHHVSLLFIQKFMGHLSEEMQGYYVRSNEDKKREAEISQNLLENIIKKEVTLLGGKGKEIADRIEEFIKKGNYNIAQDMDSLLDDLDGKISIRVKLGGFCIKASEFRECSRDEKTNEIYCAYNICPNICHVYYMANNTYDDFVKMQKSFEYNSDNGFVVQASKELNKIKSLCKNRLIPELEDLKNRIEIKGVEAIIFDHPQLIDVIEKYDAILDEIKMWMRKKC